MYIGIGTIVLILIIILMVAIAAVFWVDSRYPALLKRYHAGSQVKATGALSFGTLSGSMLRCPTRTGFGEQRSVGSTRTGSACCSRFSLDPLP